MSGIIPAIITVLGTLAITKLTQNNLVTRQRYEIYSYLDFNLSKKYYEKEYLYFADYYSSLCETVINEPNLYYLFDKLSIVYLRKINYLYRSLCKYGKTNLPIINKIFIYLLKIHISKFHHNLTRQFNNILNRLGYPTSTIKRYMACAFIFISLILGTFCFSYTDFNNLLIMLNILEYSRLVYFALCFITFISLLITIKLFDYLL